MSCGPGLADTRLRVVKPDCLLRRTAMGVLRGMGMHGVHEALHLDHAAEQLALQPFDARLMALDARHDALRLLERLRDGGLPSDASVPVALKALAVPAGARAAHGGRPLQARSTGCGNNRPRPLASLRRVMTGPGNRSSARS